MADNRTNHRLEDLWPHFRRAREEILTEFRQDVRAGFCRLRLNTKVGYSTALPDPFDHP